MLEQKTIIADKFDYQDLINEMQLRTGYSYYRVRTILKELSRFLQENIRKGNPIECLGVCGVDFTITGYALVSGKPYGLEKQAEDLSNKLQLEYVTMINFLNNYYLIIKNKIEQGYQVNIKGVCYITPRMKENNIYLDTRMSPQLKKPEVSEFVVFQSSEGEEIKSKIFEGKQLRLSMTLHEELKIPNHIMTADSYVPEYIDLSKKI